MEDSSNSQTPSKSATLSGISSSIILSNTLLSDILPTSYIKSSSYISYLTPCQYFIELFKLGFCENSWFCRFSKEKWKFVSNFDVEAEIVQLAEMHVNWCTTCGLCKDTMKCVIDDDAEAIHDKIVKSDAEGLYLL